VHDTRRSESIWLSKRPTIGHNSRHASAFVGLSPSKLSDLDGIIPKDITEKFHLYLVG